METIFSKIINRQIPAEIVYEDDQILAFKDIQPQAPVHILVIHKTPTATLSETTDDQILGKLLSATRDIAKKLELDTQGYRVVINNGASAGQSVFHLHLHLLAGRAFSWPPG